MGRKRVPWINNEEWLAVKENVVSQVVDNNIRAYETLLVWKARSINLPVNVECTLTIVQALVQYHAKVKTPGIERTILETETELQMAFALALVRFINHISFTNSSVKGDSLYTIAQRKNIPDWIVNLRHDIAHSSSLPPLEILESALLIAKQWLIENYWEAPSMDFSVNDETVPLENTVLKVDHSESLAFAAVQAWVACTIDSSIQKLSAWHCVSKLSSQLESSKLKLKSVGKSTADAIQAEMQHLQSGKRSKIRLTMLSNRILQLIDRLSKITKCTPAILQAMQDANFLNGGNETIVEWAPLVRILHRGDSLEGLLQYLFDQVRRGGEVRNVVMWLQALIKPLENQFHTLNPGHTNNEENPDWLELDSLKLPVIKMETVRPLLMDNFPDLDHRLLLRYMQFVKRQLNPEQWSLMNDLMKVYQGDEASESLQTTENAMPYSVEVLPSVAEPVGVETNETWRPTAYNDSEAWHKCPIGCLPWQGNVPMLQLPRAWSWQPIELPSSNN